MSTLPAISTIVQFRQFCTIASTLPLLKAFPVVTPFPELQNLNCALEKSEWAQLLRSTLCVIIRDSCKCERDGGWAQVCRTNAGYTADDTPLTSRLSARTWFKGPFYSKTKAAEWIVRMQTKFLKNLINFFFKWILCQSLHNLSLLIDV